MTDAGSDRDHPGRLAYAEPFSGRIFVLYDRVHKVDPHSAGNLPAYVLAHEITHVLQGIPRHSTTGIMRAQ